MITLCIIAGIVFVLWMGYSGWASPLMRENEDGSWTTLRPEKKFSDLFKKQTPTKNEDVFVDKDAFKKLAGIGIPKSADTTNTDLLKELADKWSKDGFPEPDQSIPVKTTKITTINTNFGNDNDPLAQIPLSRVSNEGKQKMADIAREDIRINTETISNEIMGSIGTKPKTQTDYAREHTPVISKKRKPKSVKQNEAEFELGGSE
jgi:hypothetical protein